MSGGSHLGKILAPIMTLVGWSTSTFTRNRSHLVKKEAVRSNVRSRFKTPPRFRLFGWASQGGCRFERKRNPFKYRHDPTDKSREQESGGGASGATHKIPTACVRMVPSASASGDGDASGNGGSSARSSKGEGAGSVSWRGQLWRPNELRFQGDVQLVRVRLGSSSQPGAELGASGCRSLHRRFGHQYLRRSVAKSSERTYTARVSGLGARFVG